jgi:hypothetical protein
MLYYFEIMGPFSIPMTLILIANVILFAWRGSQVFGADARRDSAVEAGINAILFWGMIALVLGYLGMYTGAYRSLSALATYDGEIVRGLLFAAGKELSSTPIAGLTIFLLSALGWFLLRSRHRQLPA